nr:MULTISPECIES: DPP IV N-terminal domain-containing protein [Myxococcaceae]
MLLAALLLPALALAQAPVIQISGANFRPLPLAYPQPLADAGAQPSAPAFDEAMSFDLAASGLFQVLDRKGFLADAKEGLTAGSINFARWADVGADSLVKVALTGSGEQLRGELRLFSVGSGREDFKVALGPTQPRALAHALADALYRHLTREPGPYTSRLTFVRKAGPNRDVFVADWDGRNAKPLTQGGINLLPTVAPNGDVAFTTYRSGQPDLFVSHGGAAPVPLVQARQMLTGVAYSPDGSRIAYALAEGEGAHLYVAAADGSGKKRITDGFGINTSPSWSPDGRRLAFVSNRGGSPQVYVMNADGTGVRRLTFRGNYNQTPDWSPRGDLIAFTARDERNAFDLFTVNVDTGVITRLTQDQGNNEEPSFSPNGRLIVFSSTRTGPARLYVMTADGNNQVPLPMDPGTHLTPDWGTASAR